jgi:hypothetical protein
MIAYDKTEVANRGEELSEIWWQGRQWAVTSSGLECRDGSYTIEAKRLAEHLRSAQPYAWTEHIGKKTWADVEDFATAYLVAVALHGFKLTKAMRAVVMKGHERGIVSHEKSALHRKMFPDPEGVSFKLYSLEDLDRECDAVDKEYRRRREAAKDAARPREGA